ncbi:MAG: hypothetical protein R6U17_02305 [Thermoplasmata archaeon]
MANLRKKALVAVLTFTVLLSASAVASHHSTEGDHRSFESFNLSDDSSWQMHPAVWGDLVVWEDYRDDPLGGWASPGNRNSNIYLYNMSSKESLRLTQNDSSQVNPDIWENYVVWEDYRNGAPDIYMLDLNNMVAGPKRLTPDKAQQNPRIHGGRVVWEDYRDHDYGDIYMYDIETSTENPISTEIAIQREPDIYEDKIVWMDYRNFQAGIYDSMVADIFMYDISRGIEMAVVEEEIHQRQPSIYRETVVWTEYYDGRNNICTMVMGEQKRIISDEISSEERPMIYGGRMVFYERYYDEEGVHLYGSIYMYDIIEETKHLVARVELDHGDPPSVTYARNPVIYRNNIIWEERHPSNHPKLDSQYDIYHHSLDSESPEIIWGRMESHTGEQGTSLNVTLEDGTYVTVSCQVSDKDGDLEWVYLYSDDLGIDKLDLEREAYQYFNVDIPVLEKGESQITVVAVDQEGNEAFFHDLILNVLTPAPEIRVVGVGTSTDDLDSQFHFVLEEGNILYFEAEIHGDVESVRLFVEDYLPEGAEMAQENGLYYFTLEYEDTMDAGNKTAYIEVTGEWTTVTSHDMIITAVEPDETTDNGRFVFYISLLIIVVILVLVVLVMKFKGIL